MAKVGIKDVAIRAGVSIATVSHALRNPNRVAKSTREKVLEAVKEIGYTPNNMGVSLRTAKSKNIVTIIPDITDSHNSDIITAIEKVAYQHGYSVLLGNSQGLEEREREFANMTASRQADGIILLSHKLPFTLPGDGDISRLPPLVNGCEPLNLEGIPTVCIDDIKAGFDAAKHLIDYGHKDIGVITGDMSSPSSDLRLQGFMSAISQAKLLLGDCPTAICCFSDEIALGAMAKLRHNGIQVPEDISVIGFDGIKFGKYSNPALTTILQPAAEIGEICTRILVQLLEGERPSKIRHVLPHSLKIR